MYKLAPSILSADFSKLAADVAEAEKAGAHLIHVDVMDGHFVPNISFGATVMKSLMGKTTLPFDVHLMIENPDKYAADFMTSNTAYITVHQEACPHLHRSLYYIKSLGAKAGVSINPATPVATLSCILAEVDLVLLMSVNPGFGGQQFIAPVLEKVRELKAIKEKRGFSFEIEIDGGITLNNVRTVVEAGVSIVVAGSSVFQDGGIGKNVKAFLEK